MKGLSEKIRLIIPALSLAFALFAAAAGFAPAAMAADADDEDVLSVSTDDGLVVLHGKKPDLEKTRDELQANLRSGVTNLSLLRFLSASGLDASLKADAYLTLPSQLAGAGAIKNRTTVRQAVREGLIPPIEGRELYEAYMLAAMRGDTLMIIGQAPPETAELRHTIFLFSSTWGSDPFGILIDGKNYSADKTGYNLIAMDPAGEKVTGAAGFETFSDTNSGRAMQNFLDSQPPGTLMLGEVKIGPGVYYTAGDLEALRRYGSAVIPNSQVLSSHAFLGRKSLAPGKAMEASVVNGPARIVLFRNDLYIPADRLDSISPADGARIIAISGTAPGDTVFIVGAAD